MTTERLRLRGAWFTVAWLLVLFVIYLSLTPAPIQIPVKEGDKLGHFIAYGTVMLWFAQLYRGRVRYAAAAGLVALGVVIEFVQRWTGYRTFDVWDMAADAAGVLVGWLAAPPRLPNLLAGVEKLLLRWS